MAIIAVLEVGRHSALSSYDREGGIDEKEFLGGSSYRRVEPSVEVRADGFGRYGAYVEIDVSPLSALGFVACYAIGVFYL